MMSLIANGVKDMADLKIATGWDKKGNPTGFTHLIKDDFKKAAENVNAVTTTVMKELKEVYKKDTTGFFDADIQNIDGHIVTPNDCPGVRVLKVASEVGIALTTIGQGLKEFANGKVKEYEDGVETGAYVDINWADVTEKAGKSVSKVVTCIIRALQEVYTGNEDLFKKTYTKLPQTETKVLWGAYSHSENNYAENDPPLLQVLTVASGCGKLVSEVAVAVKKVQKLDFAEAEWERGGKYRHKTVSLVTALCNALVDAHKSLSVSFEAQGLGKFDSDTAKNTVQNIVKAGTDMAKLAKNTSKAIVKIQQDLNKVNVKKFSKKWLDVVKAFVEPINQNFLTDENNSKIDGFIGAVTSENTKVDELVKSVNNLDTTCF
jgi:hypothetical protein